MSFLLNASLWSRDSGSTGTNTDTSGTTIGGSSGTTSGTSTDTSGGSSGTTTSTDPTTSQITTSQITTSQITTSQSQITSDKSISSLFELDCQDTAEVDAKRLFIKVISTHDSLLAFKEVLELQVDKYAILAFKIFAFFESKLPETWKSATLDAKYNLKTKCIK